MDELKKELLYKIEKLLVISDYQFEFGRGQTADEILALEEQAIDYYMGKAKNWEMNSPKAMLPIDSKACAFRAKIKYQIAGILDFVDKYENQLMDRCQPPKH